MISFNLSNDLGLLHFLERFGAIALGNVIEVVVVVVVGVTIANFHDPFPFINNSPPPPPPPIYAFSAKHRPPSSLLTDQLIPPTYKYVTESTLYITGNFIIVVNNNYGTMFFNI